jgi:hypothetical protein
MYSLRSILSVSALVQIWTKLNSSPDTFYGSVGVLTCLNWFQFSFTELPMMLPLMMTRGQRKCLNLSLERSQRLWKGLSREYNFATRLSAFGVSAWDVVTEIDSVVFNFSGSTASHAFVLETKAQGRFQGSPAVIKYRVPTKAVLQV